MSDGPNNNPIRCPPEVHDAAEKLVEEYNYPTKGEALRHLCRDTDLVD